jgi:hypothetical protein
LLGAVAAIDPPVGVPSCRSTADRLVATTVGARLCAPPDLLAPVPASPDRAATLVSAPARKYDKRAEQPITAENQRFTHTTDPTPLRRARLISLSLASPTCQSHYHAPSLRCGIADDLRE